MTNGDSAMNEILQQLIPSLANSLTEQFNVFNVMHHGSHEKQLSNVFSWLLNKDGTHGLGTTFQEIFISHLNGLPITDPDSAHDLPLNGYQVKQEVDTIRNDKQADIADIVLDQRDARVVIENYGTSDGHEHGYSNYFNYGKDGNRKSRVVLLCITHAPELQRDGWEKASVITYKTILEELEQHISENTKWQRDHPEQNFFLKQLFNSYIEGVTVVTREDSLSFIKTMCETGEAVRYKYRPMDNAVEEFVKEVAQHAKKQFEEGRKTLGQIKTSLARYARNTLMPRLNENLSEERIHSVKANYQGEWEWYVRLTDENDRPFVMITFGPTAMTSNQNNENPVPNPDYSKIFIRVPDKNGELEKIISQTNVSLNEVLNGISPDDDRLLNAALELLKNRQK